MFRVHFLARWRVSGQDRSGGSGRDLSSTRDEDPVGRIPRNRMDLERQNSAVVARRPDALGDQWDTWSLATRSFFCRLFFAGVFFFCPAESQGRDGGTSSVPGPGRWAFVSYWLLHVRAEGFRNVQSVVVDRLHLSSGTIVGCRVDGTFINIYPPFCSFYHIINLATSDCTFSRLSTPYYC